MDAFFSSLFSFQTFFIEISVLLIAVILLQQRSSSLGAMMGGDTGDEIVQTRRGSDKFLYKATVVLGTIFVLGGIYSMFFS